MRHLEIYRKLVQNSFSGVLCPVSHRIPATVRGLGVLGRGGIGSKEGGRGVLSCVRGIGGSSRRGGRGVVSGEKVRDGVEYVCSGYYQYRCIPHVRGFCSSASVGVTGIEKDINSGESDSDKCEVRTFEGLTREEEGASEAINGENVAKEKMDSDCSNEKSSSSLSSVRKVHNEYLLIENMPMESNLLDVKALFDRWQNVAGEYKISEALVCRSQGEPLKHSNRWIVKLTREYDEVSGEKDDLRHQNSQQQQQHTGRSLVLVNGVDVDAMLLCDHLKGVGHQGGRVDVNIVEEEVFDHYVDNALIYPGLGRTVLASGWSENVLREPSALEMIFSGFGIDSEHEQKMIVFQSNSVIYSLVVMETEQEANRCVREYQNSQMMINGVEFASKIRLSILY
eukprot:Nk52_evm8s273 gene=Nk52_evmTU8s273